MTLSSIAKCILFGLLGGIVGAAVWAAIAYYANIEIGWLAVGIGALVGVGVRHAAADSADVMTGVIAVVVAAASILLGKYATAHLALQSVPMPAASADMIIAGRAYDLASERAAAGDSIVWPDGVDPDSAERPEHFPKGLWDEAAVQWAALSPDEQRRELDDAQSEIDAFRSYARNAMFTGSFGVFDILWFGLAGAAAFKLGGAFTSS